MPGFNTNQMSRDTPESRESAVKLFLEMCRASPARFAAAEKRDAGHEITKAHLANLDATESDARTKGGFFLAAHELMVEEVQKQFDAYERDEERAWYEMDKMWMAKLLPDRRGFEIAGGEGWKRWCDFMNHCERHVLWYETTYGVPTSKWGWA